MSFACESMNQRRSRFIAVWSSLMLYTVVAIGADYDPQFDPTAVEKWREIEVTLPAYPDDADLIGVPLSASDTFKLYIDRKSLSRGTDRVVRLTAVLESPGGARNVFYDGIRCDTREYKTYALGTRERQWRSLATAPWQFIAAQERNGFRYQLYKDYVCDTTNTARAPADVLRAVTEVPRGN